MQLTFLGGTVTVTGSKFLLTHDSTRVLVDCGLFQGFKQLRLRNWEPLPPALRALDAVVLTHAHLDHSGYLPVLAREGYSGPIYATPATCALAEILLLDSARLQEEQAEHANRHGYSKHTPARPLYTEQDAKRALALLQPVELHHPLPIADGMELLMRTAGHILGAATVQITAEGQTVLFSGDLGRPQDPIMRAPELVRTADVLLIESTYGDRQHPDESTAQYLAKVINETLLRHGGVVAGFYPATPADLCHSRRAARRRHVATAHQPRTRLAGLRAGVSGNRRHRPSALAGRGR